MIRKILIGFIVFFVLIILGESVYLLSSRKSSTKTQVTEKPTKTNTVHFPPTQITNYPTGTSEDFSSAINPDQLFWFTGTHATAHVSSKISQRYDGIVFDISSGDFEDNGTISTVYELYITDGKVSDKSRMNSFIITKQILDIATFTDVRSNTPFQIADLKKGDHVIIDLTIDLTKPMGFGFEQFTIQKL